jgi:hypothetical protein
VLEAYSSSLPLTIQILRIPNTYTVHSQEAKKQEIFLFPVKIYTCLVTAIYHIFVKNDNARYLKNPKKHPANTETPVLSIPTMILLIYVNTVQST